MIKRIMNFFKPKEWVYRTYEVTNERDGLGEFLRHKQNKDIVPISISICKSYESYASSKMYKTILLYKVKRIK